MTVYVRVDMWRGMVNDVTASKFPPAEGDEDTADDFFDNGTKTFVVEMED